MKDTTKAALITASATVGAALIAGFFLLRSKSSASDATSPAPVATVDTINNGPIQLNGPGASGNTQNNFQIARPQRHLDEALRAKLRSMIPTGTKFTIMSMMGDAESYQFAQETYTFLKAEGYPDSSPATAGVSQGIYSHPFSGAQVIRGADHYTIEVGTAP